MLDTERQYFADHREELLRLHPGKFVVIKERQVLGAFDTIEDALGAGAREFGMSSFLVRRTRKGRATNESPPEIRIHAIHAVRPYRQGQCARQGRKRLSLRGLDFGLDWRHIRPAGVDADG